MFLLLSAEASELSDTICFVGLDDMEMFSRVITVWFFFCLRLQLKELLLYC